MAKWKQQLLAARERQEKSKNSSSISGENLLSNRGRMYDSLNRNTNDYVSLSKRWEDIYKRARDYYNNEAHKGFYDTYSGTRNKQGYVSDTGRWYSELEGLRDSANEGVDELLAELDQYSRYYNEDAVKYVRGLITERQNAYNDAMKDAGEFRDTMSQWKTEDDYNYTMSKNDAVKAYESGDYDAAEQILKGCADKLVSKYGDDHFGLINSEEYKELLGFEEALKQGRETVEYKPFLDAIKAGDLDAAEEFLNGRLTKEYNSEIDWFGTLGNALSNAALDKQQGVQYAYKNTPSVSVDETDEKYWEILNYYKDKKAYDENNSEYLSLKDNADFAENSQYKSTKTGDREIDWFATIGRNLANSVMDAQQGYQTVYKNDLGYSDILYDIINGNEEAKRYIDEKNLTDFGALSVASGLASVDYLTELEDDEKAIFNYIYATEGKEKAYEYISHLEKNYLNERNRETVEKRWSELAQEAPVLTSLLTVGTAPARGISFLAQTADLIGDGQIDDNARYNQLLYATNAARDQVSKDIEASGEWGEVGSFAYGVGMSMGDFLTSTVAGFGNPTAVGLIMATGAAADTTLQGMDRGLDSERAYIMGAIAGAAEFITEKIGVENLLDKALLDKSKFNYVLKNMLTEGAEEGLTDIINWSADSIYDLISGQNMSEFKAMIAEYEAMGYTSSEAFGKAIGDRITQLGTDVAAGAASGGIMGGAGAGMQAISEYRDGKKAGAFEKSIGSFSDEEISSIKKNNKNSVAKSVDDVVSFVKNSVTNAFSGRLFVGKIDANVAQRVKSDTGISVDGKSVVLSSDDIRHIFKQHGDAKSEATRGQEAITIDNFSDVMEAIFSPDSVTSSTDKSGVVSLVFTREAENKTTAVTISSDKKKALTLKSAWITKKGQHISQKSDVQAPNQTSNNELSMNAVTSSISQTRQNVNSKISTELMQYAELAGMGENGVQMMQEIYDGKMSPEKFFEAYNAIYASGKRGGDVRSRYVALLGDNVAAMARNAGQMDALKGGKPTTAYKAGERAAKDAEGGSPPASAVQNSSSLTQQNRTGGEADPTTRLEAYSPAGAAAIPSGDAQEFKGSVTGKTYSAEAARLLSKVEIGTLDTNKSYYKLDDLGIPKEERQAWIDAGIAKERTVRGQTVVTVNTTVLKDELSRRENSSAKGLSNDTNSGTIDTADDAIWKYKSSESYKINEAIRSGRELTAEESTFIEELDRDLEKTPKYSGVTYRNISFDMQGQEAFDAFVAEHVEGELITYNAYTSTSKSETGYVVDGELTAHIEIHGENGHDISQGYGLEKEQEVLYGRKTRFVVTSVSYDGKTANIVMEEFANGERAIQRGIEGNKPTQQGHNTSNIKSSMQQMQESLPEESDDNLQDISQRSTRRDSGQRSDLQGVREEVSTGADPDVQQAKENAIDRRRVVYSSNKAMAYDAIPRDKLDAKQRKVVDIAAQIGRKVIFATTTNADGVEVDGFIAKNGDIYINPNKNVAPMAFVFKHELAHFAERAGQKYQDFKNTVRNSATFKNWLKEKGLTEQEYISQIIRERAAIGQRLDETQAIAEMMANFVGDMLFTDQSTWAEDLVRELGPKQRKTVREYIRDFFSWIKSKFVGDAGKAKVEVRKLEKAFGAAYRAAVESETKALQEDFAFNSSFGQQLKDWKDGNGKANGSYNGRYFRLGTTPDLLTKHGAPAGEVIMFEDCLLKITGLKHSISIDELSKIPSQLNDPILLFKGSVENSFVALTEIKDKIGNDVIVAVHINKKMGRSVINKITSVYSKTDNYGNNKIKNYVTEQIKQGNLLDASTKKASNWFTTSGLQLPHVVQTILDANNSIAQKSEKSTQNSKKILEDDGEQFSYTPQNEKIDDVLDRVESGELTLDEARKLLKKPEGDTPASIANLKPEDMGTTPRVSKKTNGNAGDGDSSFSESVKRSSIFDDDFKKEVGEDNFVKHYASITNKETLAEAAKRLDEGGEAYVMDWLSKKAVHMDTVDTMVGFILLKRYQDIGDYSSAAAVAQKVREVGTLSGQRVQAFSIIGRFDADMMQTYAQKELDKAWELAIEGRSDKWLEKHKEQFKLNDEEISFIRDNILYAAKMPENSRERAIALAQITTLIQNKIPPVWVQGFKAWQRVSMLLNPKTQIRNVLGNAMMAPVFVASDWFSTPLDKLISKATGVRTTGLTGLHGTKANLKAAKKGIYESYDDWKRHINTKSADQNRFEIGQGKAFDETKWGRIAKIMNGFDRFTSFLLDAGDRPFYEMWFTNSLNEQMRLNQLSEPTEEMVQIAVDEALSRTWQDDNRMTKLVSGIKKACNQIQIAGYGVGDVLIKFTKTPANLTKAIYDFSPAAILSITPQAVRLTKAIKNGTATPSMQKKFVSNFGKMAAGTMLYVAFAALYAAGHIKGSSDEDKDVAAFEKYIQGIPAYSIKIGDKWFSYDWAQPIGAVPAIIADYMESREEGSGAIDSVLGAFKAGGEVLFNQSFMTSFQTLFSADSFPEGFLDIALGEVSVPIPTIFSQLANVLDDKRRVTYDGTSETKSAIYRAMLKIPGLRNLLEAEVDVLGREVDNSQKGWFNAFFNPANVYTDTSTAVTDHAYEIYQSTGDVGAIPAKAPYSVKLQGKTVKLDDVQRAQYQKAMGDTASDLIEILLENDVYKAMNDEEKLAVLKQVYSYSAAVAKDQLDWADDYEVISGIAPYITKKDFDAMSDEERYKIVNDYIFSDYEGMEDIESEIGQSNFIINKKTANLVLSATLIGDIDKAVELIDGIELRVESYGWDKADAAEEIKDRKTSVKSTLTRYWKEAYLYAYYKKDAEEQERITDMLVKVKLYGDRNDVKEKLAEWVEAYEEENE